MEHEFFLSLTHDRKEIRVVQSTHNGESERETLLETEWQKLTQDQKVQWIHESQQRNEEKFYD